MSTCIFTENLNSNAYFGTLTHVLIIFEYVMEYPINNHSNTNKILTVNFKYKLEVDIITIPIFPHFCGYITFVGFARVIETLL